MYFMRVVIDTQICGKTQKDMKGKLNMEKNNETLRTLRHSTSHIMAQAVQSLFPSAKLAIGPATDVYIGMIVGIHNRDNDLNVNPCKNKEMSNTRSKSSDEAINLVPPRTFSLEEALEFIADDEYVEVTPAVIRLRKRTLDPKDRFRENR